MKNWKIITPLVLASVVSIAYFSGGPRVPMDNDTTSDLALSEKASENALDQKQGGFGADIDLGNGVILKVSDPAIFKSKDPEALGVEGRPMIMDITITNNGAKTLDLASFTIIQSAFDSDDAQSCSDVFESASEVNGVPADPMLAAGKSINFKWAIVCPTTAGDKLHLTFSVTGNEEVTLDSTVK
jgi:hypothetical protein